MLSIDQLAGVVWKRKITFALTFLLVLGTVALVTFLLPRVYTTGAYLYVSAGSQSSSDFEQVQTNQVITRTVAELLQTRNVADEVARRLPFEASGRNLQTTVAIAPIAQSQLITVTAEASSARRAQTIANTYARTFIERFSGRVGGSNRSGAVVELATPAPLIPTQSRPRPKLYLLIGAIVAAFAALGAALLRQRTDQRLELDASSTEVFGLPIIGRVTGVAPAELGPALLGDSTSRTLRGLAEEYRLLLANLAFANQGHRPRTIAVVSAGQGEGKSTTSVSLGRAAAEVGVRTLLVDADLRRPGLSAMAAPNGGSSTRGLSSFLVDLEPLALNDVATELAGPDLSVVPSGPIPPNPAALLGSTALKDFVGRASKVFDLVIFDTPPLSVGADASLVCSSVEGVILVIDGRNTRRTTLLQAVDQLNRSKANVLGVVVNRVSEALESAYYYMPDEAQTGGRRRRRGAMSALASADQDDE